jgi:hypothetical protein
VSSQQGGFRVGSIEWWCAHTGQPAICEGCGTKENLWLGPPLLCRTCHEEEYRLECEDADRDWAEREAALQRLINALKQVVGPEEYLAAEGEPDAAVEESEAAEEIESWNFLVEDFRSRILRSYPGCPPDRAMNIARLAASHDMTWLFRRVESSVRHEDTPYDALLNAGLSRGEARAMVRADVERILEQWRIRASRE